MTDYEALIRARLETSDVDKKIKALQGQTVSLKLDLQTGNVNIDTFLKNFQAQAKAVGTAAGNNLANGLSGGLKTWSNNNAYTMQELQRTLAGFKFQSGDINKVTQDLEHMSLEISKVTTRINNNNLRVTVSGIDELGRAVTIVKEFDHRAGELSTVGKVIAQSFDTSADGAKRFQAEVDSAFARMKELGGRIGTLQKDLIKLDPGKASDADSIDTIIKQIDRLKQEYQDLQDQFGGHFTQGQNNALTAQFEKTFDDIELISSKLDGLRTKEAEEIKLKISTDQFKADISSVEAEISKLTVTAQSTDLSLGVNHDGDINKLKTDLAELKRIRDEIEKPGVSNADLISNYEQYNTVLERVKNGTTALKKELDGLNATHGKANQVMMKSETLSNKMTAWMNQNAEAAKRYGAQIEELQNKLKNNTDPKAYQDAALAFQKIQSQAKAAGLTVDSFGASVKNAVKQMLGLTSAVAVFQMVKRVFKEMYQQLYEIDTSMTNLYKVTDETEAKYASFLKNAKQDAQELGRTVSSLVEQTATWAKLGYNIDQAAALSKVSSMYANVGEVGDDTAVADLVTSMKAFNIEAEKAITIVDPLNELGNNFATSAGDLGAGLKKSASTLSLAGVSLNEALAMLTGGAEITQNAQEFGNALKVAVMRIRGMKGELQELGEEVDDHIESISKVQTEILNLTHGKVNIFDDLGEFRNYYDIMRDIADVFFELQSTDQAALTEVLFGKVRGNQGTALLKAFQSGQVEKALQTANNSAGSAAAEQERWMGSLEAKTNAFKAAWQGLSESFLNSDFLKGAIDSGTKFLDILTKIIDKIGILPTLGIASGIAGFIKNFGFSKINIVPIFYSEPIYIKKTA